MHRKAWCVLKSLKWKESNWVKLFNQNYQISTINSVSQNSVCKLESFKFVDVFKNHFSNIAGIFLKKLLLLTLPLPLPTATCKLRMIVFSSQITEWFNSHLWNKTFNESVNYLYSSPSTVFSGMLQCSILGQLVSNLYQWHAQ